MADGHRSIRNRYRVVGEALLAVQDAVLVEGGREETNPPLEDVVHADAHGGGVPPVAVLILDHAAVAGARDEPARLRGEGALVRVGERTEWALPCQVAVRVGVELRPRRRVLQVVGVAVARHPGALDVRVRADEGGRTALRLGPRLRDAGVLAVALPASVAGVCGDEVDGLAHRLERPVDLHPADRLRAAAAQ